MKKWRTKVARTGYLLIGASVPVSVAFWPQTCALAGAHCFAGKFGQSVALAQIGVLGGMVCSLFGAGKYRVAFVAIALGELAFVYLALLGF